MTLTDRLAEALRAVIGVCKAENINNTKYDHVGIAATNALAEYEASRTHPAEGGQGRYDFTSAMRLCDAGLDEWKSKEHNRRWWKRIDGTPIPNDLLCCIAQQFAAAPPPQPVAPEAVPNEMARTIAYNAAWRAMLDAGAHVTDARVAAELAAERICDPTVAPERGEAKAVAPSWANSDAFDKWLIGLDLTPSEKYWAGEAWKECAERAKATPAPRFRDPTIEDARKLVASLNMALAQAASRHGNLTLFVLDVEDASAALNAIGAKMAEGEG